MRPIGLSFHAGSKTQEATMRHPALDLAAGVWREIRAAGFALELLNIGTGFLAFYGAPLQDVENYSSDVLVEVQNRIGGETKHIMAEPGRGLVAEAGVIVAEVLYEKRPMQLPLALKAGDRVRILADGAYTTTYASIGFNGFPPLGVVCI